MKASLVSIQTVYTNICKFSENIYFDSGLFFMMANDLPDFYEEIIVIIILAQVKKEAHK